MCNSLYARKQQVIIIYPLLYSKFCPRLYAYPSDKFLRCLNKPALPEQGKKAIIIPTFKKKGDRSPVSNYRPVSILLILSNVFDRFIFIDLYRLLEPRLSSYHYGFMKGRSCTVQLLVYLRKIYRVLENRQNVQVVYTNYE